MNQSLAEFLQEKHADSETIQEAYRFYLAEFTEDLSPEEMRQQLVEVVGDEREVDDLIHTLEGDNVSVENAALAVLSCAWADPVQAKRVQSAVEGAKDQLPVIEVAILAIAAMYGMYLLTTGGIKKSEEIWRCKPDGTLERQETLEYEAPTAPLKAVVNLFAKSS